MPVNRYRYYVGPEGLLQALPGLPAGSNPEAPMVVPAANHVSLSGRSTQDRIWPARVRRVWKMSWEWLTEDEELRIQALLRMAARSPCRLLDFRKRNTLPEDISTCGTTTGTVTSFTDTGAATPVWTSGGVPLELLGLVGGRIVWSSVTNTQTLYGTSEKHPIFSGTFGSTYRMSAFVKSNTTFRLAARPFDLLGVEQATVQSSQFASTASAWQRKEWLYTPLSGVTSAYFGLIANGSGNIETAGWQVQTDDTLRDWTFGYGAPTVLVEPDVSASYFRTKYHNIGLIVREV